MTQKTGSDNPLSHLSALKLKLVNDDDFSAIKDYFFDHLGENRAFIRMGKPKRDKRLEKILALAVRSALKTEQVVMQDMFYIYLRHQRFTHGGGRINGYLAAFFYFSDIDVGLLTMTPYPPARGLTQFVRISARTLTGKPKPSPN